MNRIQHIRFSPFASKGLAMLTISLLISCFIYAQSETTEVKSDEHNNITTVTVVESMPYSVPDNKKVERSNTVKSFEPYPAFSFNIFPNPIETSSNISIQLNVLGVKEITVNFLDQNGKVIFSKDFITNNDGTVENINYGFELESGTYYIVVKSFDSIKRQQLIVK